MYSFAEKPKYRCPRCKTQTCSLPCYKRHQQRASCSGKRDPAAFLKKSQWATPTGIDQDYNYLKSIERTIDDASQHVHEGGNATDSPASKGASRGRHPDSSLQKYLIKNRITVDHAPKGMNRQKTNFTRVSKSGNVLWTVEWSGASGKRELQDNCLESKSVAESYAALQVEKRNFARRNSDGKNQQSAQRGTKRKRVPDTRASQHGQEDDHRLREIDLIQHLRHKELEVKEVAVKSECLDNACPEAKTEAGGEDGSSSRTDYITNRTAEGETHPGLSDSREEVVEMNVDEASHSSPPVHFKLEMDQPNKVQEFVDQLHLPNASLESESMDCRSQIQPQHHYFLLKPATFGPSQVLIPLKSASSLTDSLRDQIVQEYPTIYVLLDSPEQLPPGFMLEKDYVNPVKRDIDGSRGLASTRGDGNAADARSNEQQQNSQDADGLDAKSILNMLKRDITV